MYKTVLSYAKLNKMSPNEIGGLGYEDRDPKVIMKEAKRSGLTRKIGGAIIGTLGALMLFTNVSSPETNTSTELNPKQLENTRQIQKGIKEVRNSAIMLLSIGASSVISGITAKKRKLLEAQEYIDLNSIKKAINGSGEL